MPAGVKKHLGCVSSWAHALAAAARRSQLLIVHVSRCGQATRESTMEAPSKSTLNHLRTARWKHLRRNCQPGRAPALACAFSMNGLVAAHH
eukprot:1160729-Pelagomonas_calceolata.AAC.9